MKTTGNRRDFQTPNQAGQNGGLHDMTIIQKLKERNEITPTKRIEI